VDRIAYRFLLLIIAFSLCTGVLQADEIKLIVEGTSYVGKAHPDSAKTDALLASQISALNKLGVLTDPLSMLQGTQRSEWAEGRLLPLLLTKPEYLDLGFT
jgi:hypothetical protein